MFGDREWIDLACLGVCVRGQLDCMVPRLRLGQFVEGILGENGVEVSKVQWDMFVEGCWGRISSKAFREPLRDRSGRSNLLGFREQPCSPDSVAFFEGFIIVVERCFKLLFEGDFRFEFVFGVFDEGREGASATRIYLLRLLLLRVSLCSLLVLASDTATW